MVGPYTARIVKGSKADRPYGSFPRLHGREGLEDPPEKTFAWRERVALLWKRARKPEYIGIIAFVALSVVTLTNALTPAPKLLTDADMAKAIKEAIASSTPKPNVAILAFNNIKESVVLIKTRNRSETAFVPRGSGFLLDSGGTIVTSLHVVRGAAEIAVVFFDGEESPASIAETRPESDIALLDAFQSGRKPAVLASPKDLRVGDEAIAVGSPIGLQNSLAVGVISRLGSTMQPAWSMAAERANDPKQAANLAAGVIGGLIQFDAVMYPENAGGPLVNRRGEVIGIVTVQHTTGPSGLGFAVPIDSAASVAGSNPF
jgi:S1-C subfamily serine protease